MIPPILHRIAIGPISPDSERWWAKFAELHSTWELKTHLPHPASYPMTAKYWSLCSKPAQQADLMRYEILWRVGGVYVDWDVEPYRSFGPFLGLRGFVGCEAPDRTGNAVMGFEPGHPAVKEILDLAIAEIQKPAPDIMSGGPLAVSKVCIGRDDVLILPAGTFYQMEWGERRQAKDGMYARPWVYAVHRCAASWMGLKSPPQKAVAPQDAPAIKIGAVIPTRFHPAQLEPLLAVLKGDGVYTIVQESEAFGHNIHKMWNDGVRQCMEAGCTAVAILNDDIEMAPDTLAFMERALRSNKQAAVVCTDPTARPGHKNQFWPVQQVRRPHVPSQIRLGLSTTSVQQSGFAFLYDPRDPDAPTFNEEYNIWRGDTEFFDAIRAKGRAVGMAMGLVVVHEGSYSTKRLLRTDHPWRDLQARVEAGEPDAQPFWEDVQRLGRHKRLASRGPTA